MKAFVVSHTHWDREWYATREQFRVMLLSAVDRLLDMMESDRDFRSFMLDGQAVVIEDYLEAKPGNRPRLEKLIREGRILVGPWYVLPDELLVTGEAHIRNCLIGTRICGELGEAMRVGYLPDSFGHPSQMPQILAGLGLREIVFWRGLGPGVTETELAWEGRDGTAIFGVNLPFSYGVAACLPEDPAAFTKRLRSKIDLLAPLTRTGCVLLMQGVDHVAPARTLTRNLAGARPDLPDVELVHASLPEYLEAVRGQPVEWQRATGELRSGFRAYLLGGTISTRMYLKQRSHRASVLLERTLETAAAACWVRGALPYPREEIRLAWKLFLQNMPHDSICGCSVDQVHAEMETRLGAMEDYAEALVTRCMDALGRRMGPARGAGTGSGDTHGRFLVLNALGHQRSDAVRFFVRLDESLLRRVNYETGALEEFEPQPAPRLPAGVVFTGPDGSETTASLGPWIERDIMRLFEDTQPEQLRVHEAEAVFVARSVPGLGCSVYTYRFTHQGPAAPRRGDEGLENEFLTARWNPGSATLTVIDKRTARTYTDLAAMEDSGDAGDEYTYSAPQRDSPAALDPSSVRISTSDPGRSSTLYASLRVPARLDEGRQGRSSSLVPLPFEITMTVLPGIPRVDLRISVENIAEDHRLRILFPTGMRAAGAASEGVFSVDERPLTPADSTVPVGWVEPPSTHPQKSFVSVSDGSAGLTVANRGLPEYEVIDRSGAQIAVTLLRCVGWLSRPDLRARRGNGGWTIATPGAQCPGRHTFELSIIPHAGDWDRGGGGRAARGFEVPLRAFRLDDRETARKPGVPGLAPTLPLLSAFGIAAVDRQEIVVSIVKGSERGGTLIVRCWNSSPREVNAVLTPGFPVSSAWSVSLVEDRLAELPLLDGRIEIAFGPWKIVGVELAPAAGVLV
jgi:alpha-mannosidase